MLNKDYSKKELPANKDTTPKKALLPRIPIST